VRALPGFPLAGSSRSISPRRMVGIDPHPFAAIPERPKHHTRFHRIVARILLEERALLGHPQTVTRDLERRARLRFDFVPQQM